MLIVAHRCNSIGQIERALSLGADRIEVDLRRNRKGQIVLSHDRPPKVDAPSLEEVLKRFPSERFWLEFKEPVRDSFGDALAISFLFGFISGLSQKKGLIVTKPIRYSFETLKRYGFEWILLKRSFAIHTEEFMEGGFKVGIWPVNEDFERFQAYDAIVTDNVAGAVKVLK